MIEIKETQDRDIEAVAALAGDIWREHYDGILSAGQIDYMLDKFQSPAAIAAQRKEGYRYFLVRDDGARIGYFAVQKRETDMFLSKLYLLRCARGRGYGRSCVQFVKELADRAGCTTVSLTVNKDNAGSIAAYRKLGFVVTGEGSTDIGGGYAMDDYYMSALSTDAG